MLQAGPQEGLALKGWGECCGLGACAAELIHQMDEVNDELAKRISHIKVQQSRPFRMERSHPVPLPLTFESGPDEVRAWLEAKAFSSR